MDNRCTSWGHLLEISGRRSVATPIWPLRHNIPREDGTSLWIIWVISCLVLAVSDSAAPRNHLDQDVAYDLHIDLDPGYEDDHDLDPTTFDYGLDIDIDLFNQDLEWCP